MGDKAKEWLYKQIELAFAAGHCNKIVDSMVPVVKDKSKKVYSYIQMVVFI